MSSKKVTYRRPHGSWRTNFSIFARSPLGSHGHDILGEAIRIWMVLYLLYSVSENGCLPFAQEHQHSLLLPVFQGHPKKIHGHYSKFMQFNKYTLISNRSFQWSVKHCSLYSHCYLWGLEGPCFQAALWCQLSLEDLTGHLPQERPAGLTAGR